MDRKKEELDINALSIAQENQRIQNDSAECVKKLLQERESLPMALQVADNLQSELDSAKAKLNSLVNENRVFEKPTLSELEPELFEQRKVKENMEQYFNQRRATKDILNESLDKQKSMVTEIQTIVDRMEQNAKSVRETEDQRNAKQDQVAAWFEQCTRIIQGLFKVSIDVDMKEPSLKLKCGDTTAEVVLDADKMTVRQVHLSPNKYPVDDLIKSFADSDDIPQFIRSLTQRISTFQCREKEFAALNSSSKVDYNYIKNPDVVFVQLPELDSMCAFKLYRDYPAPMLPALEDNNLPTSLIPQSMFSLVSVEPFDSARFEAAKQLLTTNRPLCVSAAIGVLGKSNW